MVAVRDPLFYVMAMVAGVVVVVAIVTIIAGMNPVALAVEMAVDALTFGAKMVGLPVMPLGFGAVRLVLEAVLDAVTFAIQSLVYPLSL